LAHEQRSFWADTAEARRLGLEAAERAVKLDPQDADAHAMLGWLVGESGDATRAEIEFKRALELNPNSADILAFAAGWMEPFSADRSKSVEMIERAIRLNPNGPLGTSGLYRGTYYRVGRYEDAWHWHEQRPRDRKDQVDYLYSAILLAELGRLDEAHAATAEMLERFPDISIEGWLGDPSWIEWERELFTKSMRKAGFPICANEKVLKESPNLIRMPECLRS
jgi:tetratricopeptide (TPR) repeat protein